MQESQRYKLYKHGKNWVTAALVGMTMVSGMAAINVVTNNHVPSVAAAGVKVNKAGLVKQLGYAKAYKASGYTAASFNKLQSDIRLATSILNNARASQASVNWFIDLLHKDAANLVKQGRVDKSGLVKQIGWSKAYQAKGYTVSSFNKLQNDLKTANTVLNNPKATQGDVSWIIKVLHNDATALVKVANFAGLQQQLGWSMSRNADDYTVGSYAALAEDIKTAKNLLATKNASQQAVNDIIAKLHADGLALVPYEKTAKAAQTVLIDMYYNLTRQFAPLSPLNQFANYTMKIVGPMQEELTISDSVVPIYSNYAFKPFEDSYVGFLDGELHIETPLEMVENNVIDLYSALYGNARTNNALNAKDAAGMTVKQHLAAAVTALKDTHPNAHASGKTLTMSNLKPASYVVQMQALRKSADSIIAGFGIVADNVSAVKAQAAFQNDLKQIDNLPGTPQALTNAPLAYLSSADQQTLATAIASAKKVADTNGLPANAYATANTAYRAAVKQAFLTASKVLVNSAQKDLGMSLQAAYKKSYATKLGDDDNNNNNAYLTNIAHNVDAKNDLGVANVVQDFIDADNIIGVQGRLVALSLKDLASAHKNDPLYLKLQGDIITVKDGYATIFLLKPGVTNYQVFLDSMNYLNKYPDTKGPIHGN